MTLCTQLANLFGAHRKKNDNSDSLNNCTSAKTSPVPSGGEFKILLKIAGTETVKYLKSGYCKVLDFSITTGYRWSAS
ncbi:MAG: hypothetical protein JKY52_10050 [Flavobacteriales bacterium]|nr:hypothetical protein [Flavobacteriales bacterium]